MSACVPIPPVSFREGGRWRRAGAGAFLAALLAAAAPALAQAPVKAAPSPQRIEIFVREGCPHCADAEAFLAKLSAERPALEVTVRDIGRDPQALERLRRLLETAPGQPVSVPAIVVGRELIVGFVDEATTGALIRGRLDAVGSLASGTVVLPWIGRVGIDDVGLPAFTIAIGLLDGFNPCSMWVLVMMISMLAAVGDRRRMIAVAGTFVLVQGVAYFAFMAAWLNLFLLIGLSRPSEIVLGVVAIVAGLVNVKDFVALGRGVTLSIPAAAKPGIVQRMRGLIHERSLALAVAGTVVLAVLVQVVELLCTSGLPALYTRILTLRVRNEWSYYGYLVLYNVVYMIDDVLVLGVGVVTLSQRRLQEKEGRALKLVSGLVMVGLGAYLLASPF